MPRARYLAPWQQVDLMEKFCAGAQELDMEALAGLRGKPAIYHCISRVVDRRFVLGTREKEKFVALMRLYEQFCQVQVLAFCVMSNHFHILLEVPSPPPERGRDWSDEQLLDHLSQLYSAPRLEEIRWWLAHYRGQENHSAAEDLRDSFFDRMWDLSQFMKPLKQCFTRWFNKEHERRGTLWEERFKSVLVEDGHAARVMAAYIDLNPVRAGMVTNPKNYRWCSYGEAMGGRPRAREGIQQVMLVSAGARNDREPTGEPVLDWRTAVGDYREVLFAHVRRDPGREDAEAARLTDVEVLGQQVRHFIDGMVIGLQPFVDRVFLLTRGRFGPKRKDGARRIRGIDSELRAMRDLT